MIVYVLEQYHWNRDFWSPVGKFSKKEVADAIKETLERSDRNISCTVFEENVFDSVDDYLAQATQKTLESGSKMDTGGSDARCAT